MKQIKLTQGVVARIDDDDYEKFGAFNWHNHEGYGARMVGGRKNRKMLRLHREIMQAPADMEVDHIDGDRTNCQKSNMRLVPRWLNRLNLPLYKNSKSGYKGVTWHGQTPKWVASIRFRGKQIHIGLFENKHDAAIAYNACAMKLFGEFARLNSILPEQSI